MNRRRVASIQTQSYRHEVGSAATLKNRGWAIAKRPLVGTRNWPGLRATCARRPTVEFDENALHDSQ
jgi:hypothetical protein